MLTDAQWAMLEPLVEACRPHAKVPPSKLRRTVGAILWRHANGAKWRSLPSEFGPWWMAAQTFIRWSRLGVWERLLVLAQERGVQLGVTFLDGTSVRAHQKASGAAAKGATRRDAVRVRRLAALAAATAPRPARSPTRPAGRSPSGSPPDRPTNCPKQCRCWTPYPACRAGPWPIVATPATASARMSGTSARDRRSRPSGTRRPWPARAGSAATATGSSACGRG